MPDQTVPDKTLEAPSLLAEPGVVLALGFTTSLVLAAVLQGLPLGPAAGTACFAAVVAVLAVGSPRRTAVGSAAIAWSVLTGFVVHRLGTLTFAPATSRAARCSSASGSASRS